MATPPPKHGFNFSPTHPSPATEVQQLTKARQIGGNTNRRMIGIRWTDFEHSAPGSYDTSVIQTIHDAIMTARANSGNPDLKALIIFAGPIPSWVVTTYPDQIDVSAHGSYFVVKKSPSGATAALDRFGMAVAKALAYLSGAIPLGTAGTTDEVCDFIEIYNEPNGLGGSPDPMQQFGPIDPYEYGDMAAYAGYWVWQTLNSGSSPPQPNAHLLFGAVATGEDKMPPWDYQTYLQDAQCQLLNTIYSIDPTNVDAIQLGVRASFHPEPADLTSDTVAVAVQAVKDKINNVVNLTASQQPGVSGRRVWITETAFPSAGTNPNATENHQQDYLQQVSNFAGGFPRVEGFTYFPVSDIDLDVAGPKFDHTGVTYNALANKAAATWTAANW